ncbi:GNAT family N-acetyltransferase, partial [Candidatus Saccharibacteria bacterium]|nr:GNAT family N-acetyltransferase [Candidatus Saccharibacteria bacterium]
VITVKDEQPIKELLEHNDIRNTTKNIDRLTGVVDFLLNDTESSAVFTKPSSLIRELFTHEGDGTLVRSGDAIDSFYTLNDVNQNQLRNIIENAFGGRKLIQDYFDKLPNDTQTLITAQRYDGVAIITPRGLNNPVAYLDKIAVSKMAQSAGVGKELIDKAIDMHPDGLYWRTKITNARSLNWYIEVADRYSINEDWAIFGVNIEDDKIFEECIKHALVKDVSI